MPLKCKKCNSTDLQVKDNGPHKELFCAECLAFQRFLSKKEANRMCYLLNKGE